MSKRCAHKLIKKSSLFNERQRFSHIIYKYYKYIYSDNVLFSLLPGKYGVICKLIVTLYKDYYFNAIIFLYKVFK